MIATEVGSPLPLVTVPATSTWPSATGAPGSVRSTNPTVPAPPLVYARVRPSGDGATISATGPVGSVKRAIRRNPATAGPPSSPSHTYAVAEISLASSTPSWSASTPVSTRWPPLAQFAPGTSGVTRMSTPLPSTPSTPSVPSTPSTPSVPSTPSTPSVPSVPSHTYVVVSISAGSSTPSPSSSRPASTRVPPAAQLPPAGSSAKPSSAPGAPSVVHAAIGASAARMKTMDRSACIGAERRLARWRHDRSHVTPWRRIGR